MIIYALHITQVSVMHPIITKIGYHNRDYFLGQWDKSVTGLGATPLTQHICAAKVGGIPSIASSFPVSSNQDHQACRMTGTRSNP